MFFVLFEVAGRLVVLLVLESELTILGFGEVASFLALPFPFIDDRTLFLPLLTA